MSTFTIRNHVNLIKAIGIFCLAIGSSPTTAAIYGGVNFTGIPVTFADVVVSYDPLPDINNELPNAGSNNPNAALGAPDYITSGPFYTSLGVGGSLTLGFSNKYFTGSGNVNDDLWVFEIGTPEAVKVEISNDKNTWFSLGIVKASSNGVAIGIDIDQFGYGLSDFFSFVRLTDVANEGEARCSTTSSYCFVGADIDAVGVTNSSFGPVVPVPAAFWLFGSALVGVGFISKRKDVQSL